VKPFVVSPNAADDLNDTWRYLAEEASPDVADRTWKDWLVDSRNWPKHQEWDIAALI
jgi:plasmid stabilization system protein ParE